MKSAYVITDCLAKGIVDASQDLVDGVLTDTYWWVLDDEVFETIPEAQKAAKRVRKQAINELRQEIKRLQQLEFPIIPVSEVD